MLRGLQISRYRRLPTLEKIGMSARHVGLALLAMAIGSATLTFDKIIEHRPELNYVGEFAGAVVYPSDFFLVIGLATWAVGWYLSPRSGLRFGPWYVFIPFLLLAVLTTLSVLWSIYGTQAGFSALRRLLLLSLYVVMVNDYKAALVPIVAVLFGFGLLHAVVALAQVALGSPLGLTWLGEIPKSDVVPIDIGNPRGYGLGFNPNPIGLFLAVVSVLAFGLFLANRSRSAVEGLTLGVFVVTFFGLVATISRAALLGWLFAFSLVSLLVWVGAAEARVAILKRIWLAVFVVLMAVGLVGLVSSVPGIPKRSEAAYPMYAVLTDVYDRINLEVISRGFRDRVADWKLSFPIIRKHWALGVGAGNSPVALKEEWIPDELGSFFVPVHNILILMLVELGVIGAAAWSLIMVAPMVWLVSKKRSLRFEPESLLWLGPHVVILCVSIFEFGPWATQDARLLMPAVLGLWVGGMVRDRRHLTLKRNTRARDLADVLH